MKYTIYVTLEPILYKSTLDDITCGFKTNKPENISRLVCAKINNLTLGQYFEEGIECSTIGKKMSDNLIRVATQRIFSDPYRSFIEPVVNSVDAYNEKQGISSTTGKFGMGFFSLLYWIIDDGSILIESTYQLEKGYCKWTARITHKKDGFYFELLSSDIVDNGDSGTKITIRSKSVIPMKLINMLNETFYLLPNYRCLGDFMEGNTTKLMPINPPLTNLNGNTFGSDVGDTINVKQYGNDTIFSDNATGITLSVFLTKLLIPTISTKTIEKSLSNRLTYINNLKSDIIVTDKKAKSTFSIFICGISIYTSTIYGIDKQVRIVLVLPDQTPLPVSRDDIILEDDIYYSITLKNMLDLLQISIVNNVKLEKTSILQIYLDHLKSYASYANDNNVYRLVSTVMEKLLKMKEVYLVAHEYSSFYNEYIRPITNKYYIGSNLVDTTKLERHILSLKLEQDKSFDNRILVLLDMNMDVTTGGIISVLFVNRSFTKNKDWRNELVSMRHVRLYNEDIQLPDVLSLLIKDNKQAYLQPFQDSCTLEYTAKFADLITSMEQTHSVPRAIGEGIYMGIHYHFISIMYITCHLSSNTDFIASLFNVTYYTLFKTINRKINNTTDKPTLIINPDISTIFGKGYDLLSITSNVKHWRKGEINTNYMLKYITMFMEPYAITNDVFVTIVNPYLLSLYNITGSYIEIHRIVLKYATNKPVIYSFVVSLMIRRLNKNILKYVEKVNEIVVKYLDYIYKELELKYGEEALKDMLKKLIVSNYYYEGFNNLVDTLLIGIDILDNIINEKEYRITLILNEPSDFIFTANQLIAYVYENELDDSFNWLYEVSKVSRDKNFQALEIAINEGTTKPFMEAVIAELTQNSIDASREAKNSDYLSLQIGKLDNSYCISVHDRIGIQDRGIVALLLPFYSTKSAEDVKSSGEMGTGFMNVYRQPYCKEVHIKTVNDKHTFYIRSVPVLDKYNRVIDLNYSIDMRPKKGDRGTTISIILRDNIDHVSLVTEGLFYAYAFYPLLDMSSYINHYIVKIEKRKLFSNDMATVYIVKENIKSVMLTNGVPYSWLSPYIPKNFKYLEFSIVLDIRKSSYKPVQSRKKIILDEDSKHLFRDTINLTSILAGMESVMSGIADDTNFPGIKYSGDPRQSKMAWNYVIMGEENIPRLSGITFLSMRIDSLANIVNSIIEDRKLPINVHMTKEHMKPLVEKYITDREVRDPEIRSKYTDFVYYWFSNKIIKDVPVRVETPGIVGKSEVKNYKIAKVNLDLFWFTNNIVRHCWLRARALINQGKLKGFTISKNSPDVLFAEHTDNNLGGFYIGSEHIIYITTGKLRIFELVKAVKKYKELYKTKDKGVAENYVNNTSILNGYIGRKAAPVTVIHEFMHAIKGDSFHDVHGDISFVYNKVKYNETFFSGANELWSILIEGYDPNKKV